MKPVAIILFILGALLGVALIAHFGFADVLHSLAAMSWAGFGAILGFRAILILIMGGAWWTLANNRSDSRWYRFVWGRLIRDGASEILPFSQIGGFVAGARAITISGINGTFAAASTVVDLTTELLAQLAYIALGLGLLVWLAPGNDIAGPLALGLAIMTVIAIVFLLIQARGAGMAERICVKLAKQWLGAELSGSSTVQAEIHAIHGRRRWLAASVVLHLVCWMLSGLEAWLMLHFMGVPISLTAALVIDSMICAIRSFAFMVPNALGVQETGFILLGSIFGITPDAALALSLARRARDIIIGTPGLLIWQFLEGRKIIKKTA
jgi:putative membrane protein